MDRDAFVHVMNEASGLLEAGDAAGALARLTAFDEGLTEQPDPQDYGWIVSYRFRSAFGAGDFAQALQIAENGPARFAADIPSGSMATMYSMAVEAATQLGQAESAVVMADRCIALRRQVGTPDEVLMGAMTACTLLGDIERFDLALRYAHLLIAEGDGFDKYRAYGYYALCAALEHNVGDSAFATLWAGRDWLGTVDNEFAKEAKNYLDNSPAVKERLAQQLPDGLGGSAPLSPPGPLPPVGAPVHLPPPGLDSIPVPLPPPGVAGGAPLATPGSAAGPVLLPPPGPASAPVPLPPPGPASGSVPLLPPPGPASGQLPVPPAAGGSGPPLPIDPFGGAVPLSSAVNSPAPHDLPLDAPTQYLPVSGALPVPGNRPPADQCAGGAAADALVESGRFGVAAAAYRALIDEALDTGRPDLMIMGKAVLGLLTALIFDNRLSEAHAVWIDEAGATAIGIQALERGQTSLHDLFGYRLIEAYLHSLAVSDRDDAIEAVNTIMGTCIEYAFDKEREVVPGMINNWRRHLYEIFDDNPPAEVFAPVEIAERRWGQPVPLGPLYWSRPSPWVVDWL